MPLKHWCESDYFAARERARKAWECSQPQLVLGLEGADAGTTSLVASAPSSPPNPEPPPIDGDGEGGLE